MLVILAGKGVISAMIPAADQPSGGTSPPGARPGSSPGKIRGLRHGRPGAARPRAHPWTGTDAGIRIRTCRRHPVHWASATRRDRGGPSAPDPDLSMKPQSRSHIRPSAGPQPGAGRDRARHARPGPAGGRPIHPDGTGVSGSCPAGQERPDFRPLGGADPAPALTRDMTFLYAAVERPGSPARRSRRSA